MRVLQKHLSPKLKPVQMAFLQQQGQATGVICLLGAFGVQLLYSQVLFHLVAIDDPLLLADGTGR